MSSFWIQARLNNILIILSFSRSKYFILTLIIINIIAMINRITGSKMIQAKLIPSLIFHISRICRYRLCIPLQIAFVRDTLVRTFSSVASDCYRKGKQKMATEKRQKKKTSCGSGKFRVIDEASRTFSVRFASEKKPISMHTKLGGKVRDGNFWSRWFMDSSTFVELIDVKRLLL